MIPYTHADEKKTILYYANLINDEKTKEIIENDSIKNTDEATHLACFFLKWLEFQMKKIKKQVKIASLY